MDVTPQLIEQVYFSEKFRGYDQDEVDEFLERVGATLVELEQQLREAKERAERAEANAVATPPPSRAVMSDEEEAAEATRTLMMARRTADAAIGDARSEAQRILEEAKASAGDELAQARGEADRIVGEARVKADEMLADGQQRAEIEYGSRRDDMLKAIGDLENRKQDHSADIAALESRLDGYRSQLESVALSLREALDHPDKLRMQPPLDLAIPVVDTFGVPAQEAEPVHEEPLVTPTSDPLEDAEGGAAWLASNELAEDPGEALSAPVDTSVEDASFGYEAEPAEEWSAGSWSSLGIDETDSSFDSYAGGTPLSAFEGTGIGESSAVHETTDLYGSSTPDFQPAQAPDYSPTADHGFEYVGFDAPAPAPDPAFHEPQAFSDEGFSDPAFLPPDSGYQNPLEGAFGASGDPAFTGPPTGAYGDRFSRDLDEAVNQAEVEPHDPMTAFFEKEDNGTKGRFGRRKG